jgi:aminoglycoside N3'-acetyltransferase
MQLRPLKRHAVRILPAPIVAFLRKHQRKRAGRQRRQARDASIAKYGHVDAAELTAALRAIGIAPGCVLFVQTSINDMHTFSGRATDLLNALRGLVGPSGTLMMPAYTGEIPARAGMPLDAVHQPTYTGIVNELFRRSPGVVRSLHARHSICAEGPLATALLEGHERCVFADGPGSPLDRLRQRDDALILTIGLEPGFTSFLHWIEDYEPDKLPLRVHEPAARRYAVRHPDGRTVEVCDMHVRADVAARLDVQRIARELGPDEFRWVQHRGIDLGLYFVKPLSERLVSLRDKGIFHYY